MANRNEKGFTLIEIIVSLVLMAIIAAVVSMGFLEVVRGYVFARANADTVEKGQMAITRMIKELSCNASVSPITAGTATSVTFTRCSDNTPNHILTWANGTTVLSLDGITLTDQVNSFALAYYLKNGNPAAAASAQQIQITLQLNAADNTVETFTNRVYVGGL